MARGWSGIPPVNKLSTHCYDSFFIPESESLCVHLALEISGSSTPSCCSSDPLSKYDCFILFNLLFVSWLLNIRDGTGHLTHVLCCPLPSPLRNSCSSHLEIEVIFTFFCPWTFKHRLWQASKMHQLPFLIRPCGERVYWESLLARQTVRSTVTKLTEMISHHLCHIHIPWLESSCRSCPAQEKGITQGCE